MKDRLPKFSLWSMAGMISDQTYAAIITPAAKPESDFCKKGLNSFFKKKTQAAPSAVPIKGKDNPCNNSICFTSFNSILILILKIICLNDFL